MRKLLTTKKTQKTRALAFFALMFLYVTIAAVLLILVFVGKAALPLFTSVEVREEVTVGDPQAAQAHRSHTPSVPPLPTPAFVTALAYQGTGGVPNEASALAPWAGDAAGPCTW